MSTKHAQQSQPAQVVRSYMTPSPHVIGEKQTLEDAHQLMRQFQIRHLPVLYGGQLMGVVTQRDLALCESLPGVDPRTVPVEDAMSTDMYVVVPDTPLVEVASEMAARKVGSAVVVDHGKVVGMFTSVDVARALVHVLAKA